MQRDQETQAALDDIEIKNLELQAQKEALQHVCFCHSKASFPRRICSREQRKKQLDWLATNTDDITSQSHSLFACSREQFRQVENRLK